MYSGRSARVRIGADGGGGEAEAAAAAVRPDVVRQEGGDNGAAGPIGCEWWDRCGEVGVGVAGVSFTVCAGFACDPPTRRHKL